MGKDFYNLKGPRKPQRDQVLGDVRVYLSATTLKPMEELAVERGVSISRLFQIAVDNEFDQPEPFKYDISMPMTPYIERQFVEEGGKLLNFLARFGSGISMHLLVLCRRDFGIIDKQRVLLALREVMKMGLVEEFFARKGVDRKRIRLHQIETARDIAKRRYAPPETVEE